jgi:Cdc6-like AAA superfamily ATPase
MAVFAASRWRCSLLRGRGYTVGVERLPRQAELTLPATAPRELRAACDPARPLAPEEQVSLHEDLSAVQDGDRIGRIELRVREAWRDRYIRELVTGHAGCGKSTELLRLATELRRPKQGKAFHVVYLDAYDYLNPHEVRLPQILMALLVSLSEETRWDLKRTRSAPVLWDRVRKILGSLGREVGKDLAESSGLPLLRSLFKVDRRSIRREASP